jgi:uncharacterized protein YkvS
VSDYGDAVLCFDDGILNTILVQVGNVLRKTSGLAGEVFMFNNN